MGFNVPKSGCDFGVEPATGSVSSEGLSTAPLFSRMSIESEDRRRSNPSLLRGGLGFLRGGTSRPEIDDLRGPLGLNLQFEPCQPEVDFIFVSLHVFHKMLPLCVRVMNRGQFAYIL